MGQRTRPAAGGVVLRVALGDQQQAGEDRLNEDRQGPKDTARDEPRLRGHYRQGFPNRPGRDPGREEEVTDE